MLPEIGRAPTVFRDVILLGKSDDESRQAGITSAPVAIAAPHAGIRSTRHLILRTKDFVNGDIRERRESDPRVPATRGGSIKSISVERDSFRKEQLEDTLESALFESGDELQQFVAGQGFVTRYKAQHHRVRKLVGVELRADATWPIRFVRAQHSVAGGDCELVMAARNASADSRIIIHVSPWKSVLGLSYDATLDRRAESPQLRVISSRAQPTRSWRVSR